LLETHLRAATFFFLKDYTLYCKFFPVSQRRTSTYGADGQSVCH
jgi:hypothetical protein